jgi:hypothetical protein
MDEKKILNLLLFSALLALLMGLAGISVTLLCRAAGGIDQMELYYWSLSGHGFSMLALWVPAIIAYFFVSENKDFLSINIYRVVFTFGLFLFFFSQLCIFVGYLFPQATQLSRFILTPNSKWMIIFFLINSFSQAILFFSISFGFAYLLRKEKDKKSRLSLLVAIFASLTLAISASFSNIFLQRGFWQDEWSDHLWLPLGHFSMQAITIVLFHLWSNRFLRNQEQFYKLRIFLYLSYCLFVFLGYGHLLPELFRVNTIGYWDDKYVWIPAVSSMFFSFYLSFYAIKFFRKENIFYFLSFLLFALVGGLTGIKIITDLLFKTRVLGTLFMPGHFHPLILGGFTLTMIYYLYEKNYKGIQISFNNRILFYTFLIGTVSFSSLLMYLGLGRSLRRHPFLVESVNPSFSWILLVLASVAILSLFFLIKHYFVSRFRE